jgi:predicted Rossmann-fold nucleotide-binding protein
MGREVTNIHSSDMVIILGGRSGTLGEFAIAYDEGKLIGVLQGTGGITDEIGRIIDTIEKDTGAQLLYSRDPEELVAQLSNEYETRHFRRPSCFCDTTAIGSG